MARLKLLALLLLTASLSVQQTGCQATVGFKAELNVPGIGTIQVEGVIGTSGQEVFKVINPTSEPVWVQPRDSAGNPIGPPIEVPPGGSVELPPGSDSDTTGVVGKPEPPPTPPPVEPQPKEPGLTSLSRTANIAPAAIVVQPLVSWPGINTSFPASGHSKIDEFRIAARNVNGAFNALAKLDQGLAAPNAELVGRTEILPASSSTAQFSTTLKSNKIAQFEVYVNGVLVASSATGLGGATIVYSPDGYGTGTASFLFNFGASANAVEWVTTDNIGVQKSRRYNYQN